jgi:hypothetical protein
MLYASDVLDSPCSLPAIWVAVTLISPWPLIVLARPGGRGFVREHISRFTIEEETTWGSCAQEAGGVKYGGENRDRGDEIRTVHAQSGAVRAFDVLACLRNGAVVKREEPVKGR